MIIVVIAAASIPAYFVQIAEVVGEAIFIKNIAYRRGSVLAGLQTPGPYHPTAQRWSVGIRLLTPGYKVYSGKIDMSSRYPVIRYFILCRQVIFH